MKTAHRQNGPDLGPKRPVSTKTVQTKTAHSIYKNGPNWCLKTARRNGPRVWYMSADYTDKDRDHRHRLGWSFEQPMTSWWNWCRIPGQAVDTSLSLVSRNMVCTVYRRAVRTNNDCESWHARLNRKAETCHLELYKLIMMLFREAKAVQVSVKLLSDSKVQRITSNSHSHVQAKLVKPKNMDSRCAAIYILWWNCGTSMIREKNRLSNYCVHVLACMRGGAEIARPDNTAPDQTARLNNGGHEQSWRTITAE